MKLGVLQDLAWSLSLEESGTREVLITRITTHFDHPDNAGLCQNARFEPIFGTRTSRSQHPAPTHCLAETVPATSVLANLTNMAFPASYSNTGITLPPSFFYPRQAPTGFDENHPPLWQIPN